MKINKIAIYYNELNNLLDDLKNPNFVAFANGGFQTQAINAFFLSHIEKGEKFSGVVMSYAEKPIDTADLSVLDPAAVRTLSNYFGKANWWDRQRATFWANNLLPRPKSGRETFYILFMMKEHIDMPLIYNICQKYPNHNIKIVVTIEGLANYIKEDAVSQGLFYAGRKKGITRIIYFCRGFLNQRRKNSFVKKIQNSNQYESFQLLQKSADGHLCAIPENCSYMKRAFERTAVKKISLPDDYYENAVLFSPQPFIEQYDLCRIEEPQLRILCESIKSWGYRVLVKPHPGEQQANRYCDLGFEIDTHSLSQEYLLGVAKCKPVAIIGYASTSLVTANIFWNVPAVSLKYLIDLSDPAVSIQRMLDGFTEGFDTVKAPKTVEELKSILDANKG